MALWLPAETITTRCLICGHHEIRPGTTTVTLEREGSVLVLRKVPAEVCANCGEAYVGEGAAAAALERADRAAAEGVTVEVRDFAPAE